MTTDDERDLAQALFRTLYDAGVSFQSGDLIPRLTATVRAAGFRRQGPPSDDEREAIRAAVGAVLVNASSFPERVQSRILGQDMGPLIDKVTDAALSASRRQGHITDEWEYGNQQLMHSRVEVVPAASEAVARAQAWLLPLYRRRPAGPWEPVPSPTEQEKP